MKTYTVVLRDKNDNAITRTTVEGLKAAKAKARYFLTEEFARVGAETTHEALGTDRAEVTDEGDFIVFDEFIK